MNYIISILIFFILIIIQFVIPKYMPLNIWTLYPNFILMFVVYTALNKGIMRGQITGFVYGLTWDVLSTDIFGVRTLGFTIAGYLAGSFNKKLNKNQPLTQIIVMAIGLIVTHLILNITYVIMPASETVFVQNFELSYLIIFNILINLFLTPFVFKIFLAFDRKN
ncbi:rod shape-determining protein MreD [Candidatus Ruminimicrobiellum ovillum]|uniref:rod shape-determining protein MreD n=1 Tax=Candidatus Ruminimicrobiellum ovillum TaxID=1947927 RepID=UPI00355A90DF